MQAVINKEKGGFPACSHGTGIIMLKKYERNDTTWMKTRLKPYFELFNVLENGVFYAANQLYGINISTEETTFRFINPICAFITVMDKDGSEIGLFYCDYFKRDNKSGGAWMSNVVGQSKLLGTKPVIYNVCNFTKPAPGEPALITWDDVTTMFHEFGHALHGLFADQIYPSLIGNKRSPRLC